MMIVVISHSDDIDTTVPRILTIQLDSLPSQAKTTAVAELCEHLTTTETDYPGTDLILKNAAKNKTRDCTD